MSGFIDSMHGLATSDFHCCNKPGSGFSVYLRSKPDLRVGLWNQELAALLCTKEVLLSHMTLPETSIILVFFHPADCVYSLEQ